MKIHKMSNKQFAKFVRRMVTDGPTEWSNEKYDYRSFCLPEGRTVSWIIRRRLGGTQEYEPWAYFDAVLCYWVTMEGGKRYIYYPKDLRKALQDD